MFRYAEIIIFSVFFVFSFFKTFISDFINIDTFTYRQNNDNLTYLQYTLDESIVESADNEVMA